MSWIPVSERLPDCCVDVLMFSESVGNFYVGNILRRVDGILWTLGQTSAHEKLIGFKVTHWQPLPAPPEEGV